MLLFGALGYLAYKLPVVVFAHLPWLRPRAAFLFLAMGVLFSCVLLLALCA